MHRLIAICVFLATATAIAQAYLVQRTLTRNQGSWQPTEESTSHDEAQSASAADKVWSKAAALFERAFNTSDNNVMYIVETEILAVISEAPAPSSTQEEGNSTTVAPPLPLVRPPGYTYIPATGSLYKFHKIGAPWDEAKATCESEGGYLVVVDDAVEAATIVNIVNKAGYKYTWIGLRDRRPRERIDWRTVRGAPISKVYNRWDNGRPYNNGDWTCSYLSDDKKLYDSPCHVPNHFTCEISPQ